MSNGDSLVAALLEDVEDSLGDLASAAQDDDTLAASIPGLEDAATSIENEVGDLRESVEADDPDPPDN